MMFWFINVVLIFTLCVLFAGVLIPQILLVAFRRNLFDMPDERRIHKGVVPRLGGIAFKPVIFFAFELFLGFSILWGNNSMLEMVGANKCALSFLYCAMTVLYLVGIADDLIGVRYSAKFVVQIFCGLLLIAGGVWIDDLHGVLWITKIPSWLGYLATVFVVVFVLNAINLIDGIDGLASSLCSSALLIYGTAFFILQEYVFSLLAFATLGVLVPFFYYNVFGNPNKQKKIFMGDAGSLTIGMMIVFFSIKLVQSAEQADFSEPINPLAWAFAPLLVPCFDVVRVFMHRIRNKQNPFLPDRNHIHHKLLALGLSSHWTMIIIVLFSLVFSLLNIYFSRYMNINLLLVIDVALYTVLNMWLTKRIFALNKKD